MTLSAIFLAAIAVLPADRLAMADRLFNRGECAAAKVEYAALRGEKSIPAEELLYRLAECDRVLGNSAEARKAYGELLDKFPTSARADRARLMRALAGTPEERSSELKVLDSDRVAPDIRAAALYYLGSAANDPELLAQSVQERIDEPRGVRRCVVQLPGLADDDDIHLLLLQILLQEIEGLRHRNGVQRVGANLQLVGDGKADPFLSVVNG